MGKWEDGLFKNDWMYLTACGIQKLNPCDSFAVSCSVTLGITLRFWTLMGRRLHRQ